MINGFAGAEDLSGENIDSRWYAEGVEGYEYGQASAEAYGQDNETTGQQFDASEQTYGGGYTHQQVTQWLNGRMCRSGVF